MQEGVVFILFVELIMCYIYMSEIYIYLQKIKYKIWLLISS